MLIGLDGIPLTELKTGIGHYTFELARALARVAPENDFELVYPSTYPAINLSDNKQSSSLPANLKSSRVEVGLIGQHWWSFGLPRYVRSAGVQLFHGTNYDVPLRRRCATVLTLHDLSQLTHPATHDKRSVRRARRRIPLMLRAATMIITPTQSVRREVCDHLGVNSEKVCAVPEGLRDCFRPLPKAETEHTCGRLGIESDFLLTVGTIEPRKNLETLVRAFAEVLRRAPQGKLQLVIVGKKGWLSDPLFAQLQESGVKDRIVLTGYLGDEDLRALYSSCLLFVYPSIYEGFGLPPLEAMACGAPVIASRVPALVETTGTAAHFFDCENIPDLVRAIFELIENENGREALTAAGRRHASGFSWERTAQLTLEVYDEAMRRFRS